MIQGFAKEGGKGRGHLAKTKIAEVIIQLLQDKNRPLDPKALSKMMAIIANMSENIDCASLLESVSLIY